MSGIAGIINWHGEPVARALVDEMLHAIRHRGPQGLRSEIKDHIGLGQALLSLKKGEDAPPVWLPDRSKAIVADARLYNREYLLDRLGAVSWLAGNCADAAIILACYERWGESGVALLDGDFAFAIWDRERHSLIAARDHFGHKPFFYYTCAHRLLFGSEPKQLLLAGASAEPDEVVVGEYLFNNFEEGERTFYAAIKRLKPGHLLVASAGGVAQKRYWSVDTAREIRYQKQQDYVERFRELLRDAVAKRIKVDEPVMAHLSGGLDSSSIVALAGDIYRQNGQALPRFETLSMVFGALACDESQYIESVSARVPFVSHRYSPLDEPLVDGLLEEIRWIDSPYADPQRGSFDLCARKIRAQGARVLLTGVGGDEVTHEDVYLRDLALRGMYLTLLRDAWAGSKRSYNSFSRLFTDALRGALPQPVKRLYRAARNRPWQPPEWTTSDYARRFLSCRQVDAALPGNFTSLTQQAVWQNLTGTVMNWVLEVLECKGSYHGYEARHPFFDVALAEFVMAIPLEQRITGGKWKYLIHAGLKSDLPALILNRPRKTQFDPYVVHIFMRELQLLKQMVFDGRWAAKAYIDREKALQLFEDFEGRSDHNWSTIQPVWAIATLELWLKQSLRYH